MSPSPQCFENLLGCDTNEHEVTGRRVGTAQKATRAVPSLSVPEAQPQEVTAAFVLLLVT